MRIAMESVVRADENLTALVELESAIRAGTAIATRHGPRI